jgi:hypothetical protein
VSTESPSDEPLQKEDPVSYLLYEAAQARIVDLHREAECARRAALARSGAGATAHRRRALRPRLAFLARHRRDGKRTTQPASSTP